jgi:hypothetical protein
MTQSKHLITQLELLAAKGPKAVEAVILQPTGYLVGVVGTKEEPIISLNLEAYDRFSVTMRTLEVAFDQLPSNSEAEALRCCAEQAGQRLSYLEEPLTLVEFDPTSYVAQLRSHPPYAEAETLTYWELSLWAEPHPRARLARYGWMPDKPDRELIVYPATFATVGRLAQDLAISLKNLNSPSGDA